MPAPDVLPQHRWLHPLLGRWQTMALADGSPEACPPMTGPEEGRAIGDLWVELDVHTADGNHRVTLGYEPAAGRFVGTWVGSGMAFLWHYTGALSEDGRSLILTAEGPAFDGVGMDTYRDVITFLSPDSRTFEGSVRQADGSWRRFHATRSERLPAS